MELTLAKKDLLKLLARTQGVAERKSTMPALANVLLSAGPAEIAASSGSAQRADGGGELRVAATDLYLSLSGRSAATVHKPGSVALPAKELLERVKMMPDGPIHITVNDQAAATLKAAGSARRFTLRGIPGSEFPPLPSPQEGAPSLKLEVSILRSLIDHTYFSISTDETRAHLNSALFEWDGDIVRMVTTDGHRLSKMEHRLEGRQATATMLIPLKAIQELRKLSDDMVQEARASEARSSEAKGGDSKGQEAGAFLTITQSGANAFFQSGAITFGVKLVDAQFPPYSQVIPKTSSKTVRAPRGTLADALKAVSIAANERTGGVRFELGDGVLKVFSESPESGEGVDEVPVEYAGAGITIGFNAKYFLDVLGSLHDDAVLLGLSGELDPATLRSTDSEGFLGVVMPMRI
jgi:DNA polymerase-3 subunit beta